MRALTFLTLLTLSLSAFAGSRQPLVRDLQISPNAGLLFGVTAARLVGGSTLSVVKYEGIKSNEGYYNPSAEPADAFERVEKPGPNDMAYPIFLKTDRCVVFGAFDGSRKNALNPGESFSIYSAKETSFALGQFQRGIELNLTAANFTAPDTVFVECAIGVNEPISALEQALGGVFKIKP